MHALLPPSLDELGLVPALRETAAQYEGDSLRISAEAPEEMPPVEVAAYRVAQEALINAVRHAAASGCPVRFERGELRGLLRLEVADDGRGIG